MKNTTKNTQENTKENYTYLKDYQPPNFTIQSVRLAFDLSAEQTIVEAWLEIKNLDGDLVLYGEDLQLDSLMIDGQKLTDKDYKVDAEKLVIYRQKGDFTLHQMVKIAPKDNTRLEGLYCSSGHLMTQCEPEGFRRIIYYPDRPDILAPFHVSLTADKKTYPILLAGGNLLEQTDAPDNKHKAVFYDPNPKPSYLFALVAGDFETLTDHYTTKEGRKVRLAIHVDKGNLDKTDFAMLALKNAMRWDEETYDFCYDLDDYHIVAANDFNMGAMENKGLNIFNARLVLASSDTATDSDYDFIDAVIAHEYFHNWTGNRITCRDWFQLSLKEGLTVFREQQYCADSLSALEQRIDDVKTLRMRQFAEDAGPTAHAVRPDKYIEINNFYTTTIYEKGAELIRMLYHMLGAENYAKGIQIYRARYDGMAVTCDDFFAAMQAAVPDKDLSQFMRWYTQAGTPEITVDTQWKDGEMLLTLSQAIPQLKADKPKLPHMIPLKISWLDDDGNQLTSACSELQDDMLILQAEQQSFTFGNLPENALLSINRGFTAPVIIKGDFDYLKQARLDDDGFNRWNAKEQFLIEALCAMMSGEKQWSDVAADIHALFSNLLDGLPSLWQLPDISSCAMAMQDFEPQKFYALIDEAEAFIAENFYDELLKIYQQHYADSGEDYRNGRKARQYAHNALYYLSLKNQDLLQQHFNNARNMTETFACLRMARRHMFGEIRADMLAQFADKWQDNPLVMNKWLGIQGSITDAKQLDVIKDIITREQFFSIKNPNNVYALLGQMGAVMSPAYHNQTGYQFFGDICAKLDELNPQVGARLLGMGLMNARQLTANNQAMLADMLQKLLDKNLSPDMYEIANNHIGSLKG